MARRGHDRIGFIEDCFQNRVWGRLDTTGESRALRRTVGREVKVAPKQTADSL